MVKLRRFLYLDEPALDDYLSVLEDGLRQRRESTDGREGTRGGSVDGKILKASKDATDRSEDRTEFADTAPARFDRLLELAASDEEGNNWADLQTLDQLSDLGRGTLVHVECDAYIPDLIKTLASDDLTEALSLVEALGPIASSLGLDMEGMPTREEAQGLTAFTSALKADQVFVGERDDSSWRIAGQLRKEFIRDSDIDDYVMVVGKITTRWEPGVWKPLMALPGTSLLPRAERRKLERERPEEEDGTSLEGPAVMIDVLAIYR